MTLGNFLNLGILCKVGMKIVPLLQAVVGIGWSMSHLEELKNRVLKYQALPYTRVGDSLLPIGCVTYPRSPSSPGHGSGTGLVGAYYILQPT